MLFPRCFRHANTSWFVKLLTSAFAVFSVRVFGPANSNDAEVGVVNLPNPIGSNSLDTFARSFNVDASNAVVEVSVPVILIYLDW